LSITTHQHYGSIKPHEETGRKERRISSIYKPCGKELINLIINRFIDTRYYDLLNADHKADPMAKCSDIALPLGGSKPEHRARKLKVRIHVKQVRMSLKEKKKILAVECMEDNEHFVN